MLNIGPQELLLILVVALLVVGPRRLPELGRSLGRGLREIRKAQDEVRKTVQVSLEDDAPTPTKPGGDPGGPAVLPEETAPGSEGSSSPGSGAPTAGPAAGAAAVGEISRTLGRGLAEIRRARDEVQRSFRVDLDDAKARTPGTTPSPAPAEDATSGPPVAEDAVDPPE
jgi:TatA/E family protein of Tat protein translocase